MGSQYDSDWYGGMRAMLEKTVKGLAFAKVDACVGASSH